MTTFLAAWLFIAAAVTDFFDGFLARRRGLVSNLGKVLDPLADKVLVCSSLIMLCHLKWIPGWLVCIIIAREMAVTGLRGISAEKIDVSATKLGKYKTGFQIAAIIPLLFHYPYFGLDLHAIGIVLLWIALIFTLWSGIDYFRKFFKAIL
jgi:CDP-diacylglycerol--glycerol-3-phosphate 3-phosphatidyltransferase